MSATAGKVALTKTQTLFTVDNPVGSANVVDFVGYGSADAYEGSGAAPAPSNTTSDLRAGGGATDTNNNAADFTTGTPIRATKPTVKRLSGPREHVARRNVCYSNDKQPCQT